MNAQNPLIKMVAKSLFLNLILVVYASSLNVTLLKHYDAKTCQNEPSCHIVDDPALTADRRTLRRRPCMCDADCVIYRDCCTDSSYYNELEQSQPPPFYCQPNHKVYLKTTCPDTWTDEEIKSKCHLSMSPLRSDDASLLIPVTNIIKNITYGNKYCALCQGDTDFLPWLLSPLCGEAPPGLLLPQSLPDSTTVLSSIPESLPSTTIPSTPLLSLVSSLISPTTTEKLPVTTQGAVSTQRRSPPSVEYYITNPTSKVVFRRGRSDVHSYRGIYEPQDGSARINDSPAHNRRKRATRIQVNFLKYYKYVSDIWKTAKYDPHSTFFVTKYKEKDMICAVYSKIPTDLKPHTRHCVPNTIEICDETTDPDTDKQCRSHTSLVFNKRNNKAYRNKYCATCDGAELTYLTGCPVMARDEGLPTLSVFL